MNDEVSGTFLATLGDVVEALGDLGALEVHTRTIVSVPEISVPEIMVFGCMFPSRTGYIVTEVPISSSLLSDPDVTPEQLARIIKDCIFPVEPGDDGLERRGL